MIANTTFMFVILNQNEFLRCSNNLTDSDLRKLTSCTNLNQNKVYKIVARCEYSYLCYVVNTDLLMRMLAMRVMAVSLSR